MFSFLFCLVHPCAFVLALHVRRLHFFNAPSVTVSHTQTFGEYATDKNIIGFSTTVILALFFTTAAAFSALVFLFLMAVVDKGKLRYDLQTLVVQRSDPRALPRDPRTLPLDPHTLPLDLRVASPPSRRPWLRAKSGIIFIPGVVLALGVGCLLIGLPFLASIFYSVRRGCCAPSPRRRRRPSPPAK